jgi:deoxyribonuclease IV
MLQPSPPETEQVMIRIGPAGIPLSCKGRTLKDGIIYTKSLELDALEVQFVRGIRMTVEEAREVREVAEAADVDLHVHAPYYTNLAGDERNLKLTREKVLKAGEMAHEMGAHTVVVHPGFYGERSPEEALERIVEVVGALRDEYRENQWKPQIGLVTMGKRPVFGSLEEIIEVCKQVPGVQPVVDFAHIHARGNGSLNTVEDFQEVFDQLIPLSLDHTLIHFTGVRYENGNERHHLPIKKGDLRFEPLVEVILENDYNVTLISTSPILEHDAMYMQIVLDRVKEKREQRIKKDLERQKREEEEAAIAAAAEAESKAEYEKKGGSDAKPEPAGEPEPKAVKKAPAKAQPAPKPKPEPRPPCAAFTQSGAPCSNPARTGSKYCSSHKGYRPKPPKQAAAKQAKKAASGSGSVKKNAKAPAKQAAKKAVKKAARKSAESSRARKTAGSSVAKKKSKSSAQPQDAAGKDGGKKVGKLRKAAQRLVGRKGE